KPATTSAWPRPAQRPNGSPRNGDSHVGEPGPRALDLRGLGDSERVLVLLHQSGRGKRSGLKVEKMSWRAANLFHVRRGKVTRFVNYFDRALADLGREN